MILSKIKELFIKNKKEILLFSFFIIFIFSIWDNAFAVTENWWAKSTTTDWMSALIEWINFLIKISSTIIGLLSALIALLLNPGWINGTIFGLDIYLKDIWILISNIVYFAFAFILIIISFMNIVWQWWGTWELKSALPKFVIWVIMVPFTWFFVQFILSISAFLTVSVLSLPYDVMENKDPYLEIEKNKICTNLTFDLRTNSNTDTTKEIKECTKWNQWEDWEYLWDLLSWKVESTWASSSIFSIINVYTYWVMKIQDLTSVTKNQLEDIKTLTDLWLKLIFDIIFIIVFLIIMVALFMALFARWTWLWIYAMFSPIFWLLFFFWKSKDWVSKISPLEFIKLALVPVYVSAALAFGMIFMFVAAHWLTTKQESWESFITDVSEWDEKASQLKIWVFSITLKWIQWWETKKGPDWTVINSLWNWIGQLLLEIFWLVILWIAVMAALKSSEITHNVVKPIISFGESIWSLVAKAPQYAPIIPTPGGGTMNAASLQALWSDIQSKINPMMTAKWHSLADSMFWKNTAWEIQKLKESINNATDITTRSNAVKKALSLKISTQSDVDKLKDFLIEDWKYKKEEVEKLDKTTIQDPQKFKKWLMREDVYTDKNMRSALKFNIDWEVDKILWSKTDPTKESSSNTIKTPTAKVTFNNKTYNIEKWKSINDEHWTTQISYQTIYDNKWKLKSWLDSILKPIIADDNERKKIIEELEKINK